MCGYLLYDGFSFIDWRGLDGLASHVPDLLNHFTTAQINELICQAASQSEWNLDRLTAERLDVVDDALKKHMQMQG